MTAADLLIAQTPLAVIDLETTGFFQRGLPREIVEASVVRIEPGEAPRVSFDSLIAIEGPLLQSRVHKVTPADLRGAPTFEQAAPALAEALSGALWVVFNAPFDISYTAAYFERLGVPCAPAYICTRALRGVLGLGADGKLGALCEAFGVPGARDAHVALYDTWATAELMMVWLSRMAALGFKRYGELETLPHTPAALKGLARPLWEWSAPGGAAPLAPLKSRYARDLKLPLSARALPPVGEALVFEYDRWLASRGRDQRRGREAAPVPAPAPAPPSAAVTLRPYQREAIEAILRRRRAGVRRAVVSLPTGAGKTVIFSHLAQLAQRRVLVLAHREELLAQAKDKLERALEGRARVEVEQAGRRASAEAKVVVASLRSLRPERLARLLDEEGFGLVIYDECHHAVADDNKRVLEQLGVFEEGFTGTLVGFTATTSRADGVGLEEVFEEVVYSRSLLDMIRDGYLVPVRGLRVSTAVSLEGVGGGGDFVVDELEERVNIEERNGLVARSIQELARDRRTICFCVTVHHAERLAETLRDLGVPAAAVHGELRPAERAALLRDFREGALQVITNVGVLTEGFDDPSVSCVAMARPTRSEGLYVQCVGRGMRLAEGKRDCLVLDFVDLSALRLVTLPTLVGVPVEVDFEGREAGEGAAAYWRLMEEHPGFEWEAATITLTELQERARAFDPLRLRLSPEVRAISQNGWVSLGQRGLALSFSRDGESFSELLALQTSEGGKRRYALTLDGREVGRAGRLEEAVEASDFEVGRMGHLAVETASCYAPWRAEPAPPELARELGRQLPYPPRTLEDVFRAMIYLRLWSAGGA